MRRLDLNGGKEREASRDAGGSGPGVALRRGVLVVALRRAGPPQRELTEAAVATVQEPLPSGGLDIQLHLTDAPRELQRWPN